MIEISKTSQIPKKYFIIFSLIICVQILIAIFYYSFPTIRRPGETGNPLKSRKADWIGNAYIISTKLHIPDDVINAAKACGFLPLKLPPKLPFGEHYEYNKKKMYESCFGVTGRTLHPYESSWYSAHTSLAEISLVYSHRYALDLIANDFSMQDSDWALIMEDDAVLNPQVRHDRARLYSLEAIKAARSQNPVVGFIYYGLCTIGTRTCNQEQHDIFINDSFSIGKYCHGYCTHAYAVTKFTAKMIFSEIYNNDHLKSNMLQIDQAYKALFDKNIENKSSLNAMVVGDNFRSPDFYWHSGLMYQGNRTNKARENGTSLTSNSFLPQTCFIVRSDGATVPQLLEQYVALISICLLRKIDPHRCASFAPERGGESFFKMFIDELHVRDVKCIHNNITVRFNLKEHSHSSKQLNYTRQLENIPYGSVISLGEISLVLGAESFARELLIHPSPYISSSQKSFPLGEFKQISSLRSSLYSAYPARCAPRAMDICVHISLNKSSSVNSFKRYFSSVVHRLSQRYSEGVALKFILDRAVKYSQLTELISRRSFFDSFKIESPVCVKALERYDGNVDPDIWTIRQLRDCEVIVLTGGIAGWWGAYLSSAEVIVSSGVKNALPSWTVL